MEHRDVQLTLQGLFNLKALRALDVLEVDAGGGVFHCDGGLGYRCPVLVYDFSG
jgi:hypothetical protein